MQWLQYFLHRWNKKQLKDRVKQHEAAVRNKTNASLVYQHVAKNNHTMNFPGAKVSAKSKQEKPRKLLEAFYTYSDSNSINRLQNFPWVLQTYYGWGPNWGALWHPSDHHSTIVLMSLRPALDWAPNMPRDSNLSDNLCKVLQSLL